MHNQTLKLVSSIVTNLPEMDKKTAQYWIEHPRKLKQFLQGLSSKEGVAPTKEGITDTIIRIDRSLCPSYPSFVAKVLFPELESSGPAEYDLAKVVSHLHAKHMETTLLPGKELFEYIKENKLIENCLSLVDARVIGKMDTKTFERIFEDKYVVYWKSIITDSDGHLLVPYHHYSEGKVVGGYQALEHHFFECNFPITLYPPTL